MKIFVYRPEIGSKHFDKLKPETRPEKPGPNYNSGLMPCSWQIETKCCRVDQTVCNYC